MLAAAHLHKMFVYNLSAKSRVDLTLCISHSAIEMRPHHLRVRPQPSFSAAAMAQGGPFRLALAPGRSRPPEYYSSPSLLADSKENRS